MGYPAIMSSSRVQKTQKSSENDCLKHIVLTGGGSAGHVMPNLALVDELKNHDWRISYIGSNSVEKKLLLQTDIDFYEIKSGKLRRYFSVQNFIDIFKVLAGIWQAFWLLGRLKPDVVFSKGGYVSVPVMIAAWLRRVPSISHESDLTPGLANKIVSKVASQILYSFPETKKYLPVEAKYVGNPIRNDFLKVSKSVGKELVQFQSEGLPIILVVGGSLGALRINNLLIKCLPELVKDYQIIHVTGPSKTIDFEHKNYRNFEYIGKEFPSIVACADIIVSRAGANSIFEFLAMRKPMLLIPLEIGSRGDQLDNADSFVKKGWAYAVPEKDINVDKFMAALKQVVTNKEDILQKQLSYQVGNIPQKIVDIIQSCK